MLKGNSVLAQLLGNTNEIRSWLCKIQSAFIREQTNKLKASIQGGTVALFQTLTTDDLDLSKKSFSLELEAKVVPSNRVPFSTPSARE